MLGQMIAEGAARAAQLVPLLFALNTAPAAEAPMQPAAAAAPPFEAVADEPSPLTLTEHHVAVRIRGGQAQVR